MRRFAAPCAALVVASAALSGSVHAQQPQQPQQPNNQFKEAVALFKRGEIAPACRAFERSYLDEPAPGTLFNLAVCHEREGRLADAYREFDSLATRAEEAKLADKASGLRARADALRPKLARLDLVHRGNPRSDVTGVLLDDVALLKDTWERPLYVAAGIHVLRFRYADGSIATRTTPALTAGSTTSVTMEEPALVVPAPSPRQRVDQLAVAQSSGTSGLRMAGFITGGAGLAFAAAGVVFAARTYSQRDDGEALCPSGGCRSVALQQEAYADRHDARVDATLATVGVVAGGAALVVGIILVATGGGKHADDDDGHAASFRLLPSSDGHGAGAQLGGTF